MTMPLTGIRILEFTHVISGPFCGMLLGDLGADIIKLEKPGEGEYGRTAGAKTSSGVSLWYPSYNRNKQGITLNFKNSKAKKILKEIIQQSDVLIENFRPGLLAEMGFGYEELKKIKPDIIMVSISGFGQYGPYSLKTAFDMTVVAMGGFMAVNGPPGGMPMKAGPAVSDFLAGLYGALATMAALRHRDKTGEGQYIDVAMMDSVMSILETSFAESKVLGKEPERTGNRRPYTAPSNVFSAKDDYVYIAALFQSHWENLCKAMGKAEILQDPRFTTGQLRKKNEEAVETVVSEWVKQHTVAEVLDLLEGLAIPCSPVKKISDLVVDPHIAARESLVEVDYPGVGLFPMAAFAPRFSSIKPLIKRPPLLGENNKDIVCDLLGYSIAEFQQMADEGVF